MNKKIIIILLVTLSAILLAFFVLLPSLINKETLKSEIIISFKTVTGLDLEIQGDVIAENFPLPHVIINAIDVHNAPGAASPFLLTAKVMDVHPDILPLIFGKFSINTLTVDGVNLELERLKNNQMNWKVVPANGKDPTQAQPGHILDASSIIVTNATVHYTDAASGAVTEFKDLNLKLNSSVQGKNTIEIQTTYAGESCNVKGSLANLSMVISSGVTPANLTIGCGEMHLTYDGDVGFKDNNYYFTGALDFIAADAASWVNFWLNKTDKLLPAGEFKPLPLEAKTQVLTEGNKISFPEIALSGALVTGKVAAAVTFPYHMDIKASIDSFDLETILASKLFDPNITTAEPDKKNATPDYYATNANLLPPVNPLINALDVDADITLADTTYNSQSIKDTHLIFTMANGDMSIPQFSTKLPGNSRLIFTGLGKEGYQGFTLEGQLDTAGDDFSEMLTVLKPKGFSIPPEDFKRFRIRSNLTLSSKEIRLSELAARIENIAFVGGIITTLGERTHIESALRIGGLNMDHFITLWGLEEWRNSFLAESLTPKSDALMSLWLKRLGFDLSLNASLEQYTINGKVRDKADLSLRATQGKILLSNLKTTYNNSPVAGSISLDVTGALPKVDADLAADTINLNDILPASFTATAPASPSKERWSSDENDFHWLELLNGSYNVRIGHLKYNGLEASNVQSKGALDNANFSIDNLAMETMGAQWEMKLGIKGGKIPLISLSADVRGMDNSQLSQYLTFLKGLSGKYNINLQVQTNGNNQIAWISNLAGGAGIGGRNVLVHGFNLPSIVTSIAYVRTVADILNVVKHAFPGGDTVFSTIEGQWTIAGGKINLSNTKLTNDLTQGVFDGEVDIVNWLMQGKATFALSSLSTANPPTISIIFSGNLDAPEKTLDTRSLEQYVTNKTSQKMLQDYGSH